MGACHHLCLFFDADLAIELCKALHNDTNVLICCGSVHSSNMDELLTALHCIPVFPSRKNLSTALYGSTLTEQELKSIFSTIKEGFVAQAPQHSCASPAAAKSADCKNLCASCGKQATARCRRCKKAYYCCAACQAKDWPTHKKTCV